MLKRRIFFFLNVLVYFLLCLKAKYENYITIPTFSRKCYLDLEKYKEIIKLNKSAGLNDKEENFYFLNE